eukprot:4367517-Pleurochrysis_carterae.AAC.1
MSRTFAWADEVRRGMKLRDSFPELAGNWANIRTFPGYLPPKTGKRDIDICLKSREIFTKPKRATNGFPIRKSSMAAPVSMALRRLAGACTAIQRG